MNPAVPVSVLLAVLVGVAALASYGFAWYSWQRTGHPVSNRFAVLMAADGSWALFAFLELVSPTDAVALLWSAPLALAASLAAVFWFLFVVAYTGDSAWVPDVVAPLLVGEGVLYGVVYALNPGDLAYAAAGVARFGVLRVPYIDLGPLVLAQLLFIYALLVLTFVLLGRFFVVTRNLYRKQTGIIFAVTLLVALANVAFFVGLTPHPRLDLTPVFFVVQALGVGFALYRYDFLEVAPLATDVLLEEMGDPVFVIDVERTLVDWNEAASRYVPDVANPTLAAVANDDSMVWSAAIDGLDEVIVADESGTTVTDSEVTTTRRDGDALHSVTFDVRTTDITDRYGVVRGSVVVLRDVTERREREQVLESQNERLEEFTGIVSHDLRNPLQVIDGKLTLARETGDLSHLEDAADAVAQMEQLIDDLLRLASQGESIDEKRPVSLDACSRAAWDRLDTAGATLRAESELSVLADRDRLTQALENLFRNAVEHGGPEVTVTVGASQDGFYVADDGPGIPADERAEVFEFGRTHADDGTGIGLAIVDRIVEAHNWTIAVGESTQGGARFDVTPARTGLLHAD
ncbi:histidine kinase N-terminal 7TM domain-containing protein [Halomicroarcula sp. GCM10025817]|uniref:sensor histidine kinase n=1 Tax=Haloarcula TaxID=2237 RepID=UPI0023E89359|nr:histidine kinase N-terminal 7TM domain-containing protein [Halomicroarcula sp. SYNS111]